MPAPTTLRPNTRATAPPTTATTAPPRRRRQQLRATTTRPRRGSARYVGRDGLVAVLARHAQDAEDERQVEGDAEGGEHRGRTTGTCRAGARGGRRCPTAGADEPHDGAEHRHREGGDAEDQPRGPDGAELPDLGGQEAGHGCPPTSRNPGGDPEPGGGGEPGGGADGGGAPGGGGGLGGGGEAPGPPRAAVLSVSWKKSSSRDSPDERHVVDDDAVAGHERAHRPRAWCRRPPRRRAAPGGPSGGATALGVAEPPGGGPPGARRRASGPAPWWSCPRAVVRQRPVGHQATSGQDDDAVDGLGRLGQQVRRHEHDRGPGPRTSAGSPRIQAMPWGSSPLAGSSRIEHPGIAEEGPGQLEALAHAQGVARPPDGPRRRPGPRARAPRPPGRRGCRPRWPRCGDGCGRCGPGGSPTPRGPHPPSRWGRGAAR